MAYSKVSYHGNTLIDIPANTELIDGTNDMLNGSTAHQEDGTVVSGALFAGYPATQELLDFGLLDSDGNKILDQSEAYIQGGAIYQKKS